MTIGDFIRQGLHYARTCKSLWIFGFVVGLVSGGSSSSSGGGGGQAGGAAFSLPLALSLMGQMPMILAILGVALVAGALGVVVNCICEGALIDGVTSARQGRHLTMREGFRAGWAHVGVLLQIAILYGAAVIGSLVLLAVPAVVAFSQIGAVGAVLFGVPAGIVAVPWLISLHLIQAFATRIAVIEDRRALDAVRKARLFLHGRLMHGLKLIVATFLGSFVIAIPCIIAMLVIVLPTIALVKVLSFAAIIICALLLMPVIFVFAALVGTFRSSVWTLGYLTQVHA